MVALHRLNGRWPGVTLNAGVIAGGTRPNVVAASCRVELDLRAATRPVVRDRRGRGAAPRRPPDHRGRHRAAAAGGLPPADGADSRRGPPRLPGGDASPRELGFALRDAATGGASDANTTSAAGLPSLDGLGPIGGDDHSVDEWLDLASVVPRTTLLAALMARIGEAL